MPALNYPFTRRRNGTGPHRLDAADNGGTDQNLSTVINLFAPGRVKLAESLEAESKTRLGQPLAIARQAGRKGRAAEPQAQQQEENRTHRRYST
jgi:hypothetical protein